MHSIIVRIAFLLALHPFIFASGEPEEDSASPRASTVGTAVALSEDGSVVNTLSGTSTTVTREALELYNRVFALNYTTNEADEARLISLAAHLRLAEGDTKAQFMLGMMYYTGKGVVENKAEAARFYYLAAQGDATAKACARAQRNLGYMYLWGEGIPEDKAEGLSLLRLAVDKQDAAAQCTLGLLYYIGEDVTQDKAEGLRLLELAATKNNAYAFCALGFIYCRGDGVRKDIVRGTMFLERATVAAEGNIKVMEKVIELISKLKASPLQELVTAAGLWGRNLFGRFKK